MLKYVGESNHLSSSRIDTVADNHIVWVVSRSDIVERAIGFGFFYRKFKQIKSIVEREVLPHILQVERIEAGLSFAQCHLHLAGLQNLVGVIRTDTQRKSAVNYVFTKSQRQAYSTFFCLLIVDRIIVDRTRHTRNGRIITVAILGTHYLLQDNRHLLLVDNIAGGLHIRLAVLIIYRGVNSLYGIAQHTQHFVLIR